MFYLNYGMTCTLYCVNTENLAVEFEKKYNLCNTELTKLLKNDVRQTTANHEWQ